MAASNRSSRIQSRLETSRILYALIQRVLQMARKNVFPNRSLLWYLTRGSAAGGGFGALLAFLLVLFLSGMGDGGGDPPSMIADDIRSVIPYVVGWAIMGFVSGLLWWLLGKTLGRPSS